MGPLDPLICQQNYLRRSLDGECSLNTREFIADNVVPSAPSLIRVVNYCCIYSVVGGCQAVSAGQSSSDAELDGTMRACVTDPSG